MRKIELESRILDFIQRHNLISPGETVLVGVSGGADSVCLLHILARCQKKLGTNLHVAHLNHQLRGAESEADARYVAKLADRLGIPSTIDKQDVAAYRSKMNCSLEEAARELRYSFLARVADDVGANRVAIGHTKDDQVETILMHILRGTGISGLRGLAPCSPMVYGPHPNPLPLRERAGRGYSKAIPILIIRPLLDITREETLNYCQEHQLEPRVDSSNLSLSFFRNRLRLELLPLLREYNPSVDQALLRLAEIAKDDSYFVEQQALQSWNEVAKQEDNAIYLNKRKICALPIALQSQIVRLAIGKLLGDTRDIEASHIEAVRSLLGKPVGKKTSLPHSLICWSGYDEVIIATEEKQFQLPPLCPFPPLQGEFFLKVPGEILLPGWRVIASTAQERMGEGHCEPFASPVIAGAAKQSHYAQDKVREESHGAQDRLREAISAEFDLHQTGTELFVRQRQPGDRFQPLGMSTPKKLQEFMVDAKIPRHWRERIPIVCSPRQIIWVVGWRIDDRVKITQATKEILRLEFIVTRNPL